LPARLSAYFNRANFAPVKAKQWSADGGQTWRQERIAGAEQVDFEDALFVEAQQGRIGGNIGIWKRSRAR